MIGIIPAVLRKVLAEGRERGGGILAVRLGADGGAEHVVEIRGALGGDDGKPARGITHPASAFILSPSANRHIGLYIKGHDRPADSAAAGFGFSDPKA